MSERFIAKGEARKIDRDELKAVDAKTDEEIARDVADDPDAAPLLDAEWFRNAERVEPRPKTAVSLRLDPDVVAYFKEQGPGYQTRINAVLRRYVEMKRQEKRRA